MLTWVSAFDLPISALGELSVRSRKRLEGLRVSVGDLTKMTSEELLVGKGFGSTSLNEVRAKLQELHLGLKDDMVPLASMPSGMKIIRSYEVKEREFRKMKEQCETTCRKTPWGDMPWQAWQEIANSTRPRLSMTAVTKKVR